MWSESLYWGRVNKGNIVKSYYIDIICYKNKCRPRDPVLRHLWTNY